MSEIRVDEDSIYIAIDNYSLRKLKELCEKAIELHQEIIKEQE